MGHNILWCLDTSPSNSESYRAITLTFFETKIPCQLNHWLLGLGGCFEILKITIAMKGMKIRCVFSIEILYFSKTNPQNQQVLGTVLVAKQHLLFR